ncbi:MAG: hypothetical protein EOM45_08840 [Clostridia bacterium]|nr:hypothetical protein [Clostridia bacterium]
MEFTLYDALLHRTQLELSCTYHPACRKEGLDPQYLEYCLAASHTQNSRHTSLMELYSTLRCLYAAYRLQRLEHKVPKYSNKHVSTFWAMRSFHHTENSNPRHGSCYDFPIRPQKSLLEESIGSPGSPTHVSCVCRPYRDSYPPG